MQTDPSTQNASRGAILLLIVDCRVQLVRKVISISLKVESVLPNGNGESCIFARRREGNSQIWPLRERAAG